MLTRKVVLLLSLSVLLVEGDFDTNDAGIQAMSTDKDSTSDEAPTESMNAISPDQPDTTSSSSEIADAPAASQVTAPEPAAATAISVEEEDEDESSDSEEGGKKHFSSRSAKAQSPALPPQSPAHVIDSPAVPRQPIIPQPKALVRNRTSKRRSRTNRRQI
ncbi:nucleolar and coiled-body phosphoprotein 1 isoform X2 [Epinephelus fuscoguttatus]|uniref:nucleolar and coiled-body phosphoprotein 1 isoform X2 n=1 Tax=Epinephelus fuscoguttatus TaxID=293821 RepID=UPI0020D1C724|nr:nucleolar and coiled-body phosphoprotein 1 isoform X2 [Epinephelus fuscoguttatus]